MSSYYDDIKPSQISARQAAVSALDALSPEDRHAVLEQIRAADAEKNDLEN